MKPKILISETELVNVIKTLVEAEVDLSDYDEMDLYDIFTSFFRNWIKRKYPQQYENYPISFLIKKHILEFFEEYEIDWSNFKSYDDEINLTGWKLRDLLEKLFEKQKIVLPRVGSGVKITEKYKKAIDYFLNNLDLPPYASVTISENIPNKIVLNLDFIFGDFMKSEQKVPDRRKLEENFETFLNNFLGLELGDPIHGNVTVSAHGPKYIGQDEWVKNVLNKEIKQKIRQIPGAEKLHSIRYTSGYNRPSIKIVMKSSANWNSSSELQTKIKELLKDMGYHNLRVDR